MIPNARCQCCDWTGPADLCGPLKNAHERVQPGDVMPAGECPLCNASAMLLNDDNSPSITIVTTADPDLATHFGSKASARALANLMNFTHPDRHFFPRRIPDIGHRVEVSRPFPETPDAPHGYLRLVLP